MPSPDSLHQPEHVHCSMERTEAYEVLPGRHDAGMLLLCDHASNALPPEYGTLGLPPDQLRRHIAYDIGAEAVTRHINEALGIPAVLTCYSRLLIDPNRGEDDPTLIMRLSDGAVVPGNDASIFVRLTGPQDEVAAVKDKFIAVLKSAFRQSMSGIVEQKRAMPRPLCPGRDGQGLAAVHVRLETGQPDEGHAAIRRAGAAESEAASLGGGERFRCHGCCLPSSLSPVKRVGRAAYWSSYQN